MRSRPPWISYPAAAGHERTLVHCEIRNLTPNAELSETAASGPTLLDTPLQSLMAISGA